MVGRLVVSELVGRGAHVIVGESSVDPDLVAGVRESGGRVDPVVGDWQCGADVRALVARARDLGGGRIDVVVNHVGCFDPAGGLDADRVFSANVESPYLLLTELVPVLGASGVAINVWADDGRRSSVHDATRAALQLITRLASVQGEDGGRARVELVEPTPGHESPEQLAADVIGLVVSARDAGNGESASCPGAS
jgi:NAD(P)-dependent dehydrogenase (short-subunit alcohol dehydrogenase family)